MSDSICGFNGCDKPSGHAIHFEQLCGRVAAGCVCMQPKRHGTRHECDCGAQWRYIDGEPLLRRWPQRDIGRA